MTAQPFTSRWRQRASSALSALLREVAEALVVVGRASCAHLLVVATASASAASPVAAEAPLTPDEQRIWADLVARLAA